MFFDFDGCYFGSCNNGEIVFWDESYGSSYGGFCYGYCNGKGCYCLNIVKMMWKNDNFM